MQALSKSDEQQLLDGVKMAVDLVDNQNMLPNDAMHKVAKHMQFSPGFLKAACNAFNTGRQLAQWNANDSVLDKLASFSLADYATVHDQIWGQKVEKVASVSFLPPIFDSYEEQARQQLLRMDLTTLEKSAAVVEPHPLAVSEHATNKVAKSYSNFDYCRRMAEEARREKSANEDRLNLKLHLLESYFRKFAQDRLPLAQVEHAVSICRGVVGKSLMDHVAGQFTKEKRATDHKASWAGFQQEADWKKEPYTLIDATIKQAKDYYKASIELQNAEVKLAEAREITASFYQSYPNSEPCLPLHSNIMGEKQGATTTGMFASGMGLGLARNMAEGAGDTHDKEVERQIHHLDSPEHVNELRKIRAQTVLTQLMSDPDNPLSQYDPEDVLSKYNEMVQLSPRLADQSGGIGPLLNKRMIGNTEPFEVAELLKMEGSLKDTQSSSAGSHQAPKAKVKNDTDIIR
jgi:hypothetical protein